MPTDELIIRLFCMVDDQLSDVKNRPDALLCPSEVVTIGLVFTMKGGHYRAFYRWLKANYQHFFPRLPEQSRLLRLLRDYASLSVEFLGDLSLFTVADTFGIELIHPRREGRSSNQIGAKGISNGRWIVGIKLGWLINNQGEVVDWMWLPANEPDNAFRGLATSYRGQTITLVDFGFRARDEPAYNLKYCPRGAWNERYMIETDFSWLTEQFHAKKWYHRVESHLEARLWYLAALINCLLRLAQKGRSLTQFVI
jgi:hypothetical protein